MYPPMQSLVSRANPLPDPRRGKGSAKRTAFRSAGMQLSMFITGCG